MKSLIVTGGANGLGRSIAQSASDAGYRVGIIDANIDALEDAFNVSLHVLNLAPDSLLASAAQSGVDTLPMPEGAAAGDGRLEAWWKQRLNLAAEGRRREMVRRHALVRAFALKAPKPQRVLVRRSGLRVDE